MRTVVECGAIPQLLRALQSSDPRVVEAAVRSLKMVYKVGGWRASEGPCSGIWDVGGWPLWQ